jgi:hypothetical protein
VLEWKCKFWIILQPFKFEWICICARLCWTRLSRNVVSFMDVKLICFYVMSLCELIGCILIFVSKEKSFSKARFKLTKKGLLWVVLYWIMNLECAFYIFPFCVWCFVCVLINKNHFSIHSISFHSFWWAVHFINQEMMQVRKRRRPQCFHLAIHRLENTTRMQHTMKWIIFS